MCCPFVHMSESIMVESEAHYDAVFMSGSGSTIVCAGSQMKPACLDRFGDAGHKLYTRPATFLAREEGKWYKEE